MEKVYLNSEWVITKPKFNYWQMISYMIFIAFIFTSFCCVMADSKLHNIQRDNSFLKAENSALKGQIMYVNDSIEKEYNIQDRAILKAQQ